MNLDLNPFRKALLSLNRILARVAKHPDDDDLRDGAIQRFEYTYELGWKTLKRYLESEQNQEVDRFSKKDLFRAAAEMGMIRDVFPWFGYIDARNMTVHAYDEEKAKAVYSVLPQFSKDAEFLLNELEKRLA